MRAIPAANIVLALLAVVLIANLIEPTETLKGRAVTIADPSGSRCVFHNSGEQHEIPMENCCYEVQKQRVCTKTGIQEFDLKCFVSEDSQKYYLINNRAFDYCKQEGFHVSKG